MPDVTQTDVLTGRLPGRVAAIPELTGGQARRIAIAAQQLAGPVRPVATPTGRGINRGPLKRLLESMGLLQMDSVNVLARAHLLPILARRAR
jgi:uncharacterized protein YcaQ